LGGITSAESGDAVVAKAAKLRTVAKIVRRKVFVAHRRTGVFIDCIFNLSHVCPPRH
jgi:hypothetical protein